MLVIEVNFVVLLLVVVAFLFAYFVFLKEQNLKEKKPIKMEK